MSDFHGAFSNVLKNSELEQLKAYVTAPGKLGANQADSTVLLHVTHSNLKAEFMEIRFDKHVREHLCIFIVVYCHTCISEHCTLVCMTITISHFSL